MLLAKIAKKFVIFLMLIPIFVFLIIAHPYLVFSPTKANFSCENRLTLKPS